MNWLPGPTWLMKLASRQGRSWSSWSWRCGWWRPFLCFGWEISNNPKLSNEERARTDWKTGQARRKWNQLINYRSGENGILISAKNKFQWSFTQPSFDLASEQWTTWGSALKRWKNGRISVSDACPILSYLRAMDSLIFSNLNHLLCKYCNMLLIFVNLPQNFHFKLLT